MEVNMQSRSKKSFFSTPVEFDLDGPRSKRATATNAYVECPCCSRRFLMTELEEHVNRCLSKQGPLTPARPKQQRKSPPKSGSPKTNIARAKTTTARPQHSRAALGEFKKQRETAASKRTSVAKSPTASPVKKTAPPKGEQPKPVPMVGKRSIVVEPKFGRLVEAATFRPTEEEFKDPLAYIQSIHAIAHDQGIAKIIPPGRPQEWLKGEVFNKVVKSDTFYFQTKVQEVGGLSHRGTPQAFVDMVNHYREKLDLEPFTKCKTVAGKRLRINRLYDTVAEAGGSAAVDRDDLWSEVAKQLNFPSFQVNVRAIKKVYDEVLRPVEHLLPATRAKKPSTEALPMRAVGAPTKEQAMAASLGKQGSPAGELNSAGMTAVTAPAAETEEDLAPDHFEDDDPFGFIMGRVYNLHGFTQQATRFFRKWFNLPPGTPLDEVGLDEIESEFWSIVDDTERHCRVLYGSDLDVTSHGSGFSDNLDTPWDLRKIASHGKSLLRHLPEPISGITVPMIYVGMLFSAFCWHTEDTHLYSINYLHTGHPKVWYGIGSTYAELFEATMKKCLPELFKEDPALLFHLVTMLSPLEVQRHGVPVVRAIQNPGEFIVTFPRAYHAGFNSGFNVAEAVNFACPDWLSYADVCPNNYAFLRSMVFSHQELAYIAFCESPDVQELDALFPALLSYARTERHRRHVLVVQGLQLACRWESKPGQLNSKPCHACMNECFFSAVMCPCNPDKISCLNISHVLALCSCPFSKKVLLERQKVSELTEIIGSILARYRPALRN
mmetsp:Transcript_19355/g.74324  ORF Transcript_19355/g.74324 Transcript_19355/m.74324 type:complete len:777 (+) Transcript_19355:152-2482(+)